MVIPESAVRSLSWRKSSRSGSGNATCVEVAELDLDSIK
ncbi:DUF397 domain-containing protein [Actinoallomurus rhizosphaericola]|nr:DUF397 domain-containing protein [Actinoallomurus rhizosphaericola]MCO5996525.1 DUF397 domain-containing protein [Actinoallomurus rhizosphaericola]